MKRLIFIIVFVTISGCLFLLGVQQKWYIKNKRWDVSPGISKKLSALGDSAIGALDVPVAAILLYNNEIIGAGYNTVKKDSFAGGHAEINAISDAMHKTGLDSFMKLDRQQLVLITTWEPCLMCRGAIVEYNIQKVKIIKAKSLNHWCHQWKKALHYEWDKQAATADTLQDYLFRKHPLYNEQKMKNNF